VIPVTNSKQFYTKIRFPSAALIILFLLWHPLTGSEIEISCKPVKAEAYQGEKIDVSFDITNNTNQSIRPRNDYFLSYHLTDPTGKTISYDNRRFRIPRVLRRKKTTRIEIPVFFDYPNAGQYEVEWDIVKEGQFWGSGKKWKTCKTTLSLKPLFSETFKKSYLPYFVSTGNPRFDKVQYVTRITLKNCEIRTKSGQIFGFAPGTDYPMVWIRDTATFIPYAKKFYPFDAVARGVELFLHHQSPNGEVADWVDISGNTDKNTVETDQESSLVLAAYEIGLNSPQWYKKTINGKTVFQRLEMALEWVWKNKRRPGGSLIISGFTADWGDNENTFPDQRATKLSDRSTMVHSIYTNAMYIRAIQRFIRILKTVSPPGINDKIKTWTQRLDTLKSGCMKQLYLKDRGYFISHIVADKNHPDKEKYFKLEKDMLAVGGNAEAILAGLMTRNMIRQFLDVLEKKRKKLKLNSISFTLLPPYPEGFFPHHLLSRPWSYQNGGQWDWIGARVVKGLFLNGFKKEAEKYLLEIVEKNLSRFSINEWEDRSGNPQGADFYVGAAGIIGEAIFIGYKK
jgi:hypothetical protein